MIERRDDGYDAAQHVANTHDCPDCRQKSVLVVKWDRQQQTYYAACGVCGRTEGLRKRKSTTQQWREDPESVPVQIANKLADKHHEVIDAVAAGLPPELAALVQEHFGLPSKKEGKDSAN